MKKFSTCAKRRSLLAIIAFIAVIGLMIPLTGCSEPGPSVESIAVTTLPTKTMYSIGETLSTAGMVVTATYSDGSQSAVTGYSTSGFDSTKEGGSTVTVTYEGATASFNVTINPKVVARPRASLRGGDYFAAQTVTLSTTTEGATIRYTTDGSTPTASTGTVYSTAISISATTTIKAIAYKPDWADSSILTADYFLTNMTVDKWVDGNIVQNGEQWFKFTATAATQYIYFLNGTSSSVNIQLYEIDGLTTVGTSSSLSSSVTSTVTSGKDYYIKVTPSDTGTYKILFSASSTTPKVALPAGAITLTAEKWTDGNILNAGGEQWFKFTATGSYHYINFINGTLLSANIEVYNAESSLLARSSSENIYVSTTNGSVYYIRLLPYNKTYSGTFKITFSTTNTPKRPLPTTGVTALAADTWTAGNITQTATEQWFKFTATAATHYIYFQAGSLNSSAYVQLYNDDGSTLGGSIYTSSFTTTSRTSLTTGTEYYIRMYPYSDGPSYYGSYKIMFSDSNKITVPATAATLDADIWTDGNITATADEQWFKFTAAVTGSYNSNFIHFKLMSNSTGTASSVRVQLFNSDGSILGSSSTQYSTYTISSNLTSGSEYYIKVWPSNIYNDNVYVPIYGTYKIAYSAQSTAPVTPTQVTQLTANVFAGGNLASSSDEQWFRFTATAATQIIYLKRANNNINSITVQLYAVNTTPIGSPLSYTNTNNLNTQTVALGSDYYIRVTSSYYTGQYNIAIFTSPVTPGKTATTLTDSGFVDGNVASGDEQWFTFTADSTGYQFIHFQFGTLTDLYAQLYDANGTAVGGQTNAYGNTTFLSRNVNAGGTYYIRVWPYSNTDRGTYKLLLSSSLIPPGKTADLLTADTWTDGNLASTGDVQWFSFTANSTEPKFIHFQLGTLDKLYVRLYDANGTIVIDNSTSNPTSDTLIGDNNTFYAKRSVINGNTYYIRVWPYTWGNGRGTYKLAFSSSSTVPVAP